MDHSDVLYLVVWFNIRLCLPLTVLVIGLCFMVQLQNAPVTFYLNLLVSNLVQIGSMIFWISTSEEPPVLSFPVYYCGALAALGFRLCIALEWSLLITHSETWGTSRPRVHVLVGFAMWGVWSAAVLLLRFHEHILPIFILVVFLLFLLSCPVMVFCLAKTIQSLPAATSVPTEVKRRTVAVLVLLLVHHAEMILFTDVWSLLANISFIVSFSQSVSVHTFLLNPFVDLVLFVFMCPGPTDQLLERLCCCRMETVMEESPQRD